jgi:ribonuclease J
MLKVIPLGGLGEIGLNMMLFEHDGRALLVDAGLMFPEEYMPGVDVVIPDFQYLRENRNQLLCVILTHGHEDHIGALPFFLREFDLPVYGTSFTIELLKEKLKEHNLLQNAKLHKVLPGEIRDFDPFKVEFIAVNHSIVGGVGLAIETPEGVVVHSGDFKIDQTPLDGQFTDLVRFAHYGNRGVLALFSDSTNVEKDGFTLSERDVQRTLEVLFRLSSGRLIVAVFASNITRIQQIIDLALHFRRKVLFSGKSMKTNVRIAKEEGLIRLPPEAEITEGMMDRFQDRELVMITTGSQGEPMSALTRMAQDKHKGVKIRKGDTVILSSRFIPGNERAISAIINNLYRMGAEVVYEKVSDIHSSGHGYRDELKLMLNLVKPRHFIPIHGEYRHLVKHSQLAAETGISPDRSVVVENGMVICFNGGGMTFGERVHTGRVLVDGKGVGDVGEVVLRDRLRLSGEGMVVVLLAVDEQTGEVLYGPDLVSRGFVFQDEQGAHILEDAKCIVLEVLDELERPAHIDLGAVGPEIKKRLKHFFYEIIERRPLVLPIILPL